MKIEIGKQYSIANMFKKTFVEVEYVTHPEKATIRHITGWRRGSLLVTPQDEIEVEVIQEAVDAGEDYDDIFEFCFSEYDLEDFWDGCWEEHESEDQETLDQLLEEWEELLENGEDEWFDFASWLEDQKGYCREETDWSIEGPIEVTIVEE